MAHPIEGLLNEALGKLKEISDANTVVGQPITTPDGTVIIPISKVNVGFGIGGSDFTSKNNNTKDNFGGGTGAGVGVTPIAFLTIRDGDISVLQLNGKHDSTADKIVNMVPGLVDKFTNFVSKNQGEEDTEIDVNIHKE